MSEIRNLSVDFFKVLSDSTRLELLYLLKEREVTQAYIQKRLEKSQSTVSQHLKNLIDANLVDVEINEKVNHYKIKDKKFFELLDAVIEFVIKLNKEKLYGSDHDVKDTLLT
ncbi:MAG: ArsR family transcriptional regulator [Promethearchaeota archaeon]|nr:MAG: ArsR family transcriptional regulator [Candidatus Lokiarchaeota archaeon]